MDEILQFFPLEEPRPQQIEACRFVAEAVARGYEDIAVVAPTGSGKSGIGICAAYWINSLANSSDTRGAYYLVTQKLLQHQITQDIPVFREEFRNCASIKAADNYDCVEFGNCSVGRRVHQLARENGTNTARRCLKIQEDQCAYSVAKRAWLAASVSVTNYAYFFNSVLYTSDIKPRQLLVIDEAHTAEEQVIKFVDGSVSLSQLQKWCNLSALPDFQGLHHYCDWVADEFWPRLQAAYANLKALVELSEGATSDTYKEFIDLDRYMCKLWRAVKHVTSNMDNWVLWREESAEGDVKYNIRPIFGAPFAKRLLRAHAPIRLYMSAYLGAKDVFCHSLGLQEDKVAWLDLDSDFPAKNRPIHYIPLGNMNKRDKEICAPIVIRNTVRIAASYAEERGIIHCQSYELGHQIEEALKQAGLGERVVFPRNADEREAAFQAHQENSNSIMISPSMTEGFNFSNESARWQIIPKVGFPFLGDRQVEARMLKDRRWYVNRTFMTVLQACGRIVRSKDDFGITFILDSDFGRLWNQIKDAVPRWFQEAVVWHKPTQ